MRTSASARAAQPRAFLLLVLWAGALSAPRPVRADPPAAAAGTPTARAHQSFIDGQTAFKAGNFDEALRQFEQSYALSARPELLLTLAQTMRKLGRFDDALTYCERFLQTDPTPPMQRSTYEFMGQLRAERSAAQFPRPQAPSVSPQPQGATGSALVTTTTAPPPRSHRRGLVIGLVVAGGVIVVAAAVTLGIVLSTPSNSYPDTALGTVHFGK